MENLILVVFCVFLFALIALDLAMIVSLLTPGDERKQLIVWKASAFTLLVSVLGLAADIVVAMVRGDKIEDNPFIRLGVIATVYCISLLYYKNKHGN